MPENNNEQQNETEDTRQISIRMRSISPSDFEGDTISTIPVGSSMIRENLFGGVSVSEGRNFTCTNRGPDDRANLFDSILASPRQSTLSARHMMSMSNSIYGSNPFEFPELYSCNCGYYYGKIRKGYHCERCNSEVEYRDITDPETFKRNGQEMFNKVREILDFDNKSKDEVIEILSRNIKEIYENGINNDYLKSFIYYCCKFCDSPSRDILSDQDQMCEPFSFSGVNLGAISRFNKLYSDNKLELIFDKDLAISYILYSSICYKTFELLQYCDFKGNKCSIAIRLDIIPYRASYNVIKEKYDTGWDLIYTRFGRKLLDPLRDKMEDMVATLHGFPLFENNLGKLSEVDYMRIYICNCFSVDNYKFNTIKTLAEDIENGEITLQSINDYYSIFSSIYKPSGYPTVMTVEAKKDPYGKTHYLKFINTINFYKNYDLNIYLIDDIYKDLQNRKPHFIVNKDGMLYLNNIRDEAETHYMDYDLSTMPVDSIFDLERIKSAMEEFNVSMKKKYNRTMNEEIVRKMFYSFNGKGIINADNINMTIIKSIKSVNWGSPIIVYMALFYDFSKLNLRTRVYLNYYIDNLNLANDLKDSKLMDYLVKKGNLLNDENLKHILKNIDIKEIHKYSSIKDIRRAIIEHEVDRERQNAEERYDFIFETDSVCNLVDNPIEMNGLRMRLLDAKDTKVFILGKLTDCCYKLGGAAEESMIYSILMPNSGNVVIEDIKTKEVIGTAWVWYDEKNDIYVYDNFEFSKESMMEKCIDLIEKYSMKLPYQNVHVGLQYNEGMIEYFYVTDDFNEKSKAMIKQANFIESDHEDLCDEVYSDYVEEEFALIKVDGRNARILIDGEKASRPTKEE